MNDVDTDKVAEILTFFDEISSSGEACSFIDLGNGWGLKCYYDNKHARDTSYICQKYLASHGLAPYVGKKFELVDHDGDSWFCFMTEVAETLVGYGICNSHAFCEDDDLNSRDDSDPDDLNEHYSMFCREERNDWIQEVYELTDYYYADDHAGNWGWITRGLDRKLVAIDFDVCHVLEKKIKRGEIK